MQEMGEHELSAKNFLLTSPPFPMSALCVKAIERPIKLLDCRFFQYIEQFLELSARRCIDFPTCFLLSFRTYSYDKGTRILTYL